MSSNKRRSRAERMAVLRQTAGTPARRPRSSTFNAATLGATPSAMDLLDSATTKAAVGAAAAAATGDELAVSAPAPLVDATNTNPFATSTTKGAAGGPVPKPRPRPVVAPRKKKVPPPVTPRPKLKASRVATMDTTPAGPAPELQAIIEEAQAKASAPIADAAGTEGPTAPASTIYDNFIIDRAPSTRARPPAAADPKPPTATGQAMASVRVCRADAEPDYADPDSVMPTPPPNRRSRAAAHRASAASSVSSVLPKLVAADSLCNLGDVLPASALDDVEVEMDAGPGMRTPPAHEDPFMPQSASRMSRKRRVEEAAPEPSNGAASAEQSADDIITSLRKRARLAVKSASRERIEQAGAGEPVTPPRVGKLAGAAAGPPKPAPPLPYAARPRPRPRAATTTDSRARTYSTIAQITSESIADCASKLVASNKASRDKDQATNNEVILSHLSKDQIRQELRKQQKFLECTEKIIDAMEDGVDEKFLDARLQSHVAIASIQALQKAAANQAEAPTNPRNVTFSGLILPLDWLEYSGKDTCYFFLMIKAGPHVVHTEVHVVADSDKMQLRFPDYVTFQDVSQDFEAEVTVYCCKIAHKRDSIFDHGTPKKAMEMAQKTAHRLYHVTPKKLFKKFGSKKTSSEALQHTAATEPIIAAPTPVKHRQSADFHPIAKCLLSAQNMKNGQFDLSHLDSAEYPLGRSIYIAAEVQEAAHTLEHSDFLTLFEMGASKHGVWTRRWAQMLGNDLVFFVHPKDVGKKAPVATIPLMKWKGMNAHKMSRTECARQFSFAIQDGASADVQRLSADSKEARAQWIQFFNTKLQDIASW